MDKAGIVLLNLGGPDRLETVRPFLYNLFSDRDIIPLGPPFMQKPAAWMISRLRAKKIIQMYKQIGGGSPLLRITTGQAEALQRLLNSSSATYHPSLLFKTYVGMRYWHPFIDESVEQAYRDGVKRIIGLSLYPHYSRATTGSTRRLFDEAVNRFKLKSSFVGSWCDNPLYIEAISLLIGETIRDAGQNGLYLLFSAHSLPLSFIEAGDPYVRELRKTLNAVMESLRKKGFTPPFSISYQSRSGPVKWLKPSTDEEIVELAREGVKRLVVVPISFVSDHIETLYEIDILYKRLAEENNINLIRVPSLNTHPLFIEALRDLVLREMWL